MPLPEDATAIRQRSHLAAPPELSFELDADLEAEFFNADQAPELELTDLAEEPENPPLSPAQSQRRRQLRRQVALLMTALFLFSLLASFVQFAR